MSDAIIDGFASRYTHNLDTWANTFWLGHQVAKCPLDLWVYQEVLWQTAPTVIVETGSSIGGSALFFASIFDLMDAYRPGPEAQRRTVGMVGSGRIVSVDKDPYPDSQPVHPRVTFMVGDAAGDAMARRVAAAVADEPRVMVALDSLHTYEHVARELALYGPLVTPGCYLVVEDTADLGGREAVHDYVVASDDAFVIDKTKEKHLLTFNPDGWLRRVR